MSSNERRSLTQAIRENLERISTDQEENKAAIQSKYSILEVERFETCD